MNTDSHDTDSHETDSHRADSQHGDVPADKYHNTDNRDIRAKQSEDVDESEAMDDEEIDEGDVNVLPGTGGPDDVGHSEVDPDEINLPGTAGMHPS